MRLVRMGVAVSLWLVLWSDLSVANVLSGLVLAWGLVLLFDTWHEGSVAVRPVQVARFVAHFLYKLVAANLTVARMVITPKPRINTGIVAVPLRRCSDAVATLVADAISLTPGTLTIEVRRNPTTLYVHALDVRDVEQVRADIRRLEVLAVKAFGSVDAITELAVDDTTSWRAR